MVEFLIPLFVVCFVPWLLAGWFRIPRYVGYFQYEDYNVNRYTLLLASSKAENRYFLTTIILLGILFYGFMCPIVPLTILIIDRPLALAVIYLGVFLIAITFMPSKLISEQNNKRTAQATRLVITTVCVQLIPALIVFGVMSYIYRMTSDPNNSPESMIVVNGFLYFIVPMIVLLGPLICVMTPYTVVIGHFINRLIETVYEFRLH